jgi:glutamine cyclotransferase
MSRSTAEVVREYGPFPGVDNVGGVTYDGQNVWFAAGDKLTAFDPASGKTLRSIDIAADAGTSFDGTHLYQLAAGRILTIDPPTGRVLASIPAPGAGTAADSGLAWAEGTLWVGQHRERKIYQVDPQTGAILRTIESNRFVTGVTWVDGELWHGTWEAGESDLRRVDPETGEVLERARAATRSERFGARVRRRGSVLLRRREERDGEDCPPAEARPLEAQRPGVEAAAIRLTTPLQRGALAVAFGGSHRRGLASSR